MATRMKWTNTGADLIRTQARDGAMVNSIDAPRPPRRAEHFHLHLHEPPRPARSSGRTHDAAPNRGPAMRRDQAREGEGAVLCRIGRNGSNWTAEDGEGNPLVIRTGADGRLEIMHHSDNGNGLDPKFRVSGPNDQRRGFASLAPRHAAADNNPAAIANYQQLLDRHYQR